MGMEERSPLEKRVEALAAKMREKAYPRTTVYKQNGEPMLGPTEKRVLAPDAKIKVEITPRASNQTKEPYRSTAILAAGQIVRQLDGLIPPGQLIQATTSTKHPVGFAAILEISQDKEDGEIQVVCTGDEEFAPGDHTLNPIIYTQADKEVNAIPLGLQTSGNQQEVIITTRDGVDLARFNLRHGRSTLDIVQLPTDSGL